ncbi:vpu protein [Simian immunodeficiency virus]|uniref:Protein Vpu n=1 Tax=Simian immunodeficiency virus TaxID=11723 RepID=B9V2T0_SIV|nr:vpu protein [Simian immunodeficiency virus]ACM63189.1 vpu protein [Simian immunodeficiency virus]ACM63198.1 vpu protein [Simian immunodeficiency virus]
MHPRDIIVIIIGITLLAVTVIIWLKIFALYLRDRRERRFFDRLERLLSNKEDEGYESNEEEAAELMEMGNELGFDFNLH